MSANCVQMALLSFAGFAIETTLAGAPMLRCEIPQGDAFVTQFYPPGAVYCLTPTTEELVRRYCAGTIAAPISRYELPAEVPNAPDW